jgi:hypothetical protein
MLVTTADCEKCLTDASNYYYSYNGLISVWKVALIFKVNYVTLGLWT